MSPDPHVQAVKGGPSEAAIEAMAFADSPDPAGHGPLDVYERLLAAAHHPALGLDRSVRLGDVVAFLRKNGHPMTGSVYEAAQQVARKFGGTTTHAE